MTMATTTTRTPTRSGTLHLPCCKKDAAPAPAKTVTVPKPLNPDRGVIETHADVSPDLAPEHRKGPPRVKQAQGELARSLVELTADVPVEPRDTRSLRLTLAIVELAPECPPELITDALRAYALGADEMERVAAKELRHALFGCVNNARLARFKAMIESAIAIIEERRVEDARQ
jgi:hypothetical protein